jgi:hypothetical protein
VEGIAEKSLNYQRERMNMSNRFSMLAPLRFAVSTSIKQWRLFGFMYIIFIAIYISMRTLIVMANKSFFSYMIELMEQQPELVTGEGTAWGVVPDMSVQTVESMKAVFLQAVPGLIFGALFALCTFAWAWLACNQIALDLYDHHKSSLRRLYGVFSHIVTSVSALFIALIGMGLLQMLFVFVGVSVMSVLVYQLFMLVLTLFIMMHLVFFNFFILDKKAGVFGCLVKSIKHIAGQSFSTYLSLFLILILSLLLAHVPWVGFFLALMISSLALVHVYRQL